VRLRRRRQNSAPTLINVSALRNTALYGAGLMTLNGAALRCSGCEVRANRAQLYGGGFLGGGAGVVNTPVLLNSIIADNFAGQQVRSAPLRCARTGALLLTWQRAVRVCAGRRHLPGHRDGADAAGVRADAHAVARGTAMRGT
jgi:hypothetical protein